MSANPKTYVRTGSRQGSTSRDGQMGDSSRMDKENEDDFSFAHFERQWRRHLVRFERQRLQYINFYYGDKQTGLYCEEVRDMEFQDAIDAATIAIYDAKYNLSEDPSPCHYCSCNGIPWDPTYAYAHCRTKDSCNHLGHSH